MRLQYSAGIDAAPYRIDIRVLNGELTAALGRDGWSASHNASEAIVTLAQDNEDKAVLVEQVVMAHVANTEKREANAAIDKQIAEQEAAQTPRMLREAALGDTARLAALDAKIVLLRGKRK